MEVWRILLKPSVLKTLLVNKRGQRCFCKLRPLPNLREEDGAQSEQLKGACKPSYTAWMSSHARLNSYE